MQMRGTLIENGIRAGNLHRERVTTRTAVNTQDSGRGSGDTGRERACSVANALDVRGRVLQPIVEDPRGILLIRLHAERLKLFARLNLHAYTPTAHADTPNATRLSATSQQCQCGGLHSIA